MPVLAGAGPGAGAARAHGGGGHGGGGTEPVEPVPTTAEDWADVALALGREGEMNRGTFYHLAFDRTDLHVVSHGVAVSPALVGSHVSFVRYADGSTLVMGDLAVTEDELQPVIGELQLRHLAQTAIHKHLLAHRPDVWWAHVHAHGHDAVALARDLRAVLDRTATPPPRPAPPGGSGSPPPDLDTAGIDAALGVAGTAHDGIYQCVFVRRETVVEQGMVMPPGLGSTTALNFQPLGGGRAALSGDIAMTAGEVQDVLGGLSRGGIGVVTLHNHGLTDEPRLFFVHLWATGDAVTIARALRPAIDATRTSPGARTGPRTR